MQPDDRIYMKTQIHQNLNTRETDDLLEIWQQADLEEWTELALEVVGEILQERLGETPAREQESPKPEPEDMEAGEAPVIEVKAPSANDIKKFLRQQTYENMDDMETETLIEIWQEADREEWTDVAFEVVQQILLERIGEIPERETAEGKPRPVVAPETHEVYLDVNPPQNETSPFQVSFRMVELRCPDCGKVIQEQDRVCPHCGVDLDAPLDDEELESLSDEQFEKAQNQYDLGRDFKSTLADCELALEYMPTSARAHNLHGLILDALGKTGLAIRAYREALRLDPELVDARDNLADAEAELMSRKG